MNNSIYPNLNDFDNISENNDNNLEDPPGYNEATQKTQTPQENVIIYADINKFNTYSNNTNYGVLLIFIITIILIILTINIKNLLISYFILILAFFLIMPSRAISLATISLILIFFMDFENYHIILIFIGIINIFFIEYMFIEIILFIAMLFIIHFQNIYNLKKRSTLYIFENMW